MSLAPGLQLGPYEIVAPIGAGGMGEVYRARDTRLERTVALKILPQRLAEDPDLRQRFEREAKAIAALNHPHICVLHDVGRQDGIAFLVMEYLEGQTLAQRLKKGALPMGEVLRYGIEIAEALDRAHRQGIVHRDLKPGNVMLTKMGAKLLDFGLAKLSPGAFLEEREPTLTEAGRLLGTPRYMAPEQLDGKEPDARTDLFALGAVLYEMATGERAFPGEAQVASLRSSTLPAFDRVVAHCLAKDPEDRWQNAHDLAAELRWIAEAGAPVGVARTGPRSRHELILWSLALVAAAGLAFTLGSRVSGRPDRAVSPLRSRFEIRAPEGATILGSAGLAVSPDGERIVFRGSGEGRSQLYVRRLDVLSATPIPGTEEGFGPFWSPDGREIAFVAGGKLKKVDLSAGTTQVLWNDADKFLPGSWSPGGTMIVSVGGDLFGLPASGGAPEPLGKREEGETRRVWPRFLPDGRHYLYLSEDARAEKRGVYVAALGSAERKRIVASDVSADLAAGQLLFLRGDALVAQPFDSARLELTGEAVPLGVQPAVYRFTVVGVGGPVSRAGYSVSSTGVLAWFPGGSVETRTALTWFDRTGKVLGTVGEPAAYSNPALSADGRNLAVDLREAEGKRDLWRIDLVRGGRTRLTFDRAEDLGAAWHPDGSRIAFASERRGSRDLYQKLANGAGDDELVLSSDGAMASVEDWSLDGRWLLFNWRRQQLTDLFVLPMAKGRDSKPIPFLVTEFREDMGQFSPDGRFLAYRSDESGRTEVYVRAVSRDGTAGPGRWQVSTDGGVEPRWRRDGREIFYISGAAALSAEPSPGTLNAVSVTTAGGTFVAGAPKPLFEARLPDQRRNRYVVAPDGQRFLVNRDVAAQNAGSIQVLVNALPRKP